MSEKSIKFPALGRDGVINLFLCLLAAVALAWLFLDRVHGPLAEINSLRERTKARLGKVETQRQELERVNYLYEKRSAENEKNRALYEELLRKTEKKSFVNAGAFANYIGETADSHKIKILAMGALEERAAEGEEKTPNYAASYELLGAMERMNRFLLELENSPYALSLTGAPVTLEIAEGIAKLVLKISFSLENTPDDTVISVEETTGAAASTERIPPSRLLENIKNSDVITINDKNYIVFTFANGRRKTWLENDSILINNTAYRVKTDGDAIWLECGK